MRRKFSNNPLDVHLDKEYSWLCACGGHGFTIINEKDYGEVAKKNPTPCQKCWTEMQLRKKEKPSG